MALSAIRHRMGHYLPLLRGSNSRPSPVSHAATKQVSIPKELMMEMRRFTQNTPRYIAKYTWFEALHEKMLERDIPLTSKHIKALIPDDESNAQDYSHARELATELGKAEYIRETIANKQNPHPTLASEGFLFQGHKKGTVRAIEKFSKAAYQAVQQDEDAKAHLDDGKYIHINLKSVLKSQYKLPIILRDGKNALGKTDDIPIKINFNMHQLGRLKEAVEDFKKNISETLHTQTQNDVAFADEGGISLQIGRNKIANGYHKDSPIKWSDMEFNPRSCPT